MDESGKYLIAIIAIYIFLDVLKVIFTKNEERQKYYIKLIISNIVVAVGGGTLLSEVLEMEATARFSIIIVVLLFLRMIYFWESFRNKDY